MSVLGEKLLDGLNEKQYQAVKSLEGSNLVIAGAGSGKTAVLTRRVAYLISQGVKPGKILCLTFTNKAAGEMNERVKNLLVAAGINLPVLKPWQEDYDNNPLICTFHSLGVRILREFGDKVGLPGQFNILDMDDQKKIIRGILKELNIDAKQNPPKLFTYFISQCKQELLTAGRSGDMSKEFLPVYHQVYAKYEAKLKENHTVDFDDLLLLPYIILNNNQDIREKIQERWYHLMIDEFQDTNTAQMEIVKLIQPPELV